MQLADKRVRAVRIAGAVVGIDLGERFGDLLGPSRDQGRVHPHVRVELAVVVRVLVVPVLVLVVVVLILVVVVLVLVVVVLILVVVVLVLIVVVLILIVVVLILIVVVLILIVVVLILVVVVLVLVLVHVLHAPEVQMRSQVDHEPRLGARDQVSEEARFQPRAVDEHDGRIRCLAGVTSGRPKRVRVGSGRQHHVQRQAVTADLGDDVADDVGGRHDRQEIRRPAPPFDPGQGPACRPAP